jgi:hypothetical protein
LIEIGSGKYAEVVPPVRSATALFALRLVPGAFVVATVAWKVWFSVNSPSPRASKLPITPFCGNYKRNSASDVRQQTA